MNRVATAYCAPKDAATNWPVPAELDALPGWLLELLLVVRV